MSPTQGTHGFVIPAYGDSPYLEACLHSILAQRRAIDALMITTATPSPFIADVAQRLGIELQINSAPPGIGSDWNFALAAAKTDLVTIAHQDDLYLPDFTHSVAEAFARDPGAAFAFCNFTEHDSAGPRTVNANVWVKRFLSARAAGRRGIVASARQKRWLYALGNPVCCPGVTLNRNAIGDFRFSETLRSNLDWDAWARLLDGSGHALYLNEPLVVHRVHEGSETTALIADTRRAQEDLEMFRRYWPEWLARTIAWSYRCSYRANRM